MRRSKFFHDMLDMNLDRLFRDGRTVCYLSISIALRDALLWAIEIVDLGKHQRLCRLAASLCLRETPPSDVRLNLGPLERSDDRPVVQNLPVLN